MKTLISVVICVAWLPAAGLAVATEGCANGNDVHPSSATPGKIEAKEDAEILRLIKESDAKKLAGISPGRLLPAVAHALHQGHYRERALSFVRMHLPDPRLAPHVAEAMQHVRYGRLLDAVELAQRMPDRVFLPALLDHVLPTAHWYLERHPEEDAYGRDPYSKVFAHAAELLHVITKGKVGVEKMDPGRLTAEERRKLYADWRAWWKKNKAAWLVPGALPDLREVEPKKDEEVLRLLDEYHSRKKPYEERRKAADTLADFERERLFSGVAYALRDEQYRKIALIFVRQRLQWFPDNRRLAPFVARYIRESSGEALYDAVRTAKVMPDPVFMPVLIDHALSGEWVEADYDTAVGPSYDSVFRETARTLFRITKGEIGLERFPETSPLPKEERKRLIKEWRAWWERNKAEWVSPGETGP